MLPKSNYTLILECRWWRVRGPSVRMNSVRCRVVPSVVMRSSARDLPDGTVMVRIASTRYPPRISTRESLPCSAPLSSPVQ